MTHEIARHQSTDVEARLETLADDIRIEVAAAEADARSAVQHAIRAGELLIEAKASVRHGQWLPWLAANFAGGVHTARNYMRLAANGERVLHLTSVREAVAALTAPKANGERAADLPTHAPGRRSAGLDQAFDEIKKALHESDDDGEWCYPPAWALEIILSARKSGHLVKKASRP